MAIVLTKKKLKAQAHTEVLSDFAVLIDTVGVLQEEAEQIKAKIKELTASLKPYNDAVSELEAKLEELDIGDDDTAVELGAFYRLEVGKRGTSREVTDMRQVHEMMGDDLFYQLVKINLKDLDNYLPLPKRDKVIKVNRTKRSFKLVQKTEAK